jgi:hypothetical protein
MAVLDWTQRGGLTADVAAKLLPVLSIGIHDPTLGFTDAFFHTTAQRQQEVAEAAFADIRILGIEGRCGLSSTRPGTPRVWPRGLPRHETGRRPLDNVTARDFWPHARPQPCGLSQPCGDRSLQATNMDFALSVTPCSVLRGHVAASRSRSPPAIAGR